MQTTLPANTFWPRAAFRPPIDGYCQFVCGRSRCHSHCHCQHIIFKRRKWPGQVWSVLATIRTDAGDNGDNNCLYLFSSKDGPGPGWIRSIPFNSGKPTMKAIELPSWVPHFPNAKAIAKAWPAQWAQVNNFWPQWLRGGARGPLTTISMVSSLH